MCYSVLLTKAISHNICFKQEKLKWIMLISLLKANSNMEICWFSLYESILMLLADSVEFTLSTWESNTQESHWKSLLWSNENEN